MERTQLASRHCTHCGTIRKFERHVTAMGGGDLIMIILTLGVWLLLRRLWTPPFRCSVCGSK